MRRKTKKLINIFLISILVIGVLAVAWFGFLKQTMPSQYYETAVFSFIGCEVCGVQNTIDGVGSYGKIVSYTEAAGDTAQWSLFVKGRALKFGEIFPIRIRVEKNSVLVCQDEATAFSTTKPFVQCSLSSLSPRDLVRIYYERKEWGTWKAFNDPSFVYQVSAVPYCLYRTNVLGGGKTKLNSRDCSIPNNVYTGEILSEDVQVLKDSRGNVINLNYVTGRVARTGEHLPIGEYYNYVSDFVTVPSFALEDYQGQKVKCVISGGQHIYYGFSTITTPAGTYQILDFGKIIGYPQCCERESTPTKTCQDGKWITHEEAKCSLTKPCPGSVWNPDPRNPRRIVRYNCVNGQCVPEYKEVECTSWEQCNKDEICVNYRCVKSGTGEAVIPGEESGECQDKFLGLVDAEWGTKESTVCNLWCKLGFAKPTVVKETKCYYDYSLLIIIVIAIVVLAGFFILRSPRQPHYHPYHYNMRAY